MSFLRKRCHTVFVPRLMYRTGVNVNMFVKYGRKCPIKTYPIGGTHGDTGMLNICSRLFG